MSKKTHYYQANPQRVQDLPPTFTSDAMGTLKNPLSDSGTSWWHITSPYNPDIERYGFLVPSYFMSNLNLGCVMADALERENPLTVYEVAIRIKPENLMCPQTIFKDWLQSIDLVYESADGADEFLPFDNRPNPWFSSPEFIETLTDLGKSFYHEIASKCDVYSAASVMSLVCECHYQIFDILKNMTNPSFEGWCIRNEIYGWIEIEYRDGWGALVKAEKSPFTRNRHPSGMWVPWGGFNIGVWETSKIRIREVFKDAVDCEENFLEPWKAIGRKNPQNLPIYVNNLGVHTNAPIPMYHATTAAEAIIEEGFKTPDELPRGSFGLGSSGMGLISMTGDPRYAEAICVHLATHARIGIGDLRWSELMADFRRVSPERYQRIVDGTDQGNKAKGLIRVLKVMGKGQVPVNRGMFGKMYLTTDPERYELVSMEEYVEYRREYCVSNNLEHMINSYTNPAKSTLAELYNELLWINDGTIENPVGDSDLWTRFLGQDLSILDQIAYVRAELKSGMRIVSRTSSVEMPSVFYKMFGNFSVGEYQVQKLKRGEDLYPRSSWGGYRAPTPLPESETGLTFDVDSEFVDRVPAEDYNKFAIYLPGEDEFRLPAPRDQLTPAVLEGTAMDILEVLPNLWQGKDVTCFYPRIGDTRLTLKDNLYS